MLSAAPACALCMCMLCCRNFQVHTHAHLYVSLYVCMYQHGRDKPQSLYYKFNLKELSYHLPVYPTLIVQSREFQFIHIEHAHGVVYVALGLPAFCKAKVVA